MAQITLARSAVVQELADIVRNAATAALGYYDSEFAVRTKTDASLVTEADEAVEAALIHALRRFNADVPIVSEEMVSRGECRWHGGEEMPDRYWLVDPIDGTRGFVAHTGEFTVNVALVDNRRPVIGIVHQPLTGVTWTGAGPNTAMEWRPGSRARPIRVRPAPTRGITVVSSRHHGDQDALAALLSDYRVAEHKLIGSAVKFCMIACGEADLYPRLGRTLEWDTAAGQAVLEAAGGKVMTLSGQPLSYGKPAFENPDFIAKGAW
jgi:3'(2'), 5'-bisphosphate nucleotidase